MQQSVAGLLVWSCHTVLYRTVARKTCVHGAASLTSQAAEPQQRLQHDARQVVPRVLRRFINSSAQLAPRMLPNDL